MMRLRAASDANGAVVETQEMVAVKTLKRPPPVELQDSSSPVHSELAAKAKSASAEFKAEVDLMKLLRHPVRRRSEPLSTHAHPLPPAGHARGRRRCPCYIQLPLTRDRVCAGWLQNMVSLIGVCSADVDYAAGKPLLMILEFLPGGALDEWLPGNGPKLDGTELVSMVHQVALGLVALKQAAIIHRDLAARNVLIDQHLGVKIADFGLSRETDEDKNYYRYTTDRPLPVRWTAPEVLIEQTWTASSDMYVLPALAPYRSARAAGFRPGARRLLSHSTRVLSIRGGQPRADPFPRAGWSAPTRWPLRVRPYATVPWEHGIAS